VTAFAKILTREDELEVAFPGFAMTHVLNVTASQQVSATIAILQAVGQAGASLRGLAVTRRGEGQQHQLRLCGLGAASARRLAARIADLPGVMRTDVEHQLVRDLTMAAN
jgi:hypothetical protein